jgi:hypothetical protein
MKKAVTTFALLLATLAWAAAQQPGSAPAPGTYPNAQGPGTGPPQGPGPTGGTAVPSTVVEGCLGGSNPNYTITDSSGKTYKLNIPSSADTSKLAAHVGESVDVAGNVNSARSPSIDVQGIGRGTGSCPANGSKGTPSPKP